MVLSYNNSSDYNSHLQYVQAVTKRGTSQPVDESTSDVTTVHSK